MKLRRTTLTLVAVLALLLPAAAQAKAKHAKASNTAPAAPRVGQLFDPSNLDRSVQPCTDFYAFANGGWQKHNPRPAEYAEWGRFAELDKRNQGTLRTVLETAGNGAEIGRAHV